MIGLSVLVVVVVALLDAPVGFALAAGSVAAFNPCGFAMLPAYLSFFVAGADGGSRRSPVGRALVVTAAMTLGFVIVFGLAGLAIEAASIAVAEWTPWVTLVIGVGMIPLGLLLATGREVKVNLPRLQRGGRDGGVVSMTLFGASYATVSLSCTLPVFLAAVSGSFRSGSLVGGMAAYLAYAVGMGLVVGVVTVAVALAEDGLVRRLRGILPRLNRIAGALLMVTGAYVAYYGYFEIRVLRGDDVAAGPVDWVTSWSGTVTANLDRLGVAAIALALAAVAGIGFVVRQRPVSPTPAGDEPQPTDQRAAR